MNDNDLIWMEMTNDFEEKVLNPEIPEEAEEPEQPEAEARENARPSGRAEIRRRKMIRKLKRLAKKLPKILLIAVVCLVLVSPLRGCIISDNGYIGAEKAQKIALSDAGLSTDSVSGLLSDMVKIDGQVCYKVHFSGSVTDFRYIIDATTGDIVAQNFIKTDTEE